MEKIKRPVTYLLVALVIVPFLFLALFLFAKQSAIEKAQRECGSFRLMQQEPPHNIKAELLSCNEAEEKLGWKACINQGYSSIIKVWFVSMDGVWLIQGPPNASGSPSTPIPVTYCYVLMDAITGQVFSVGAH